MPESFGAATTELSAGGVTVKAHVMGPGCSESHVVVEYEGHLFPGDMVANDAHSWLEIGRTDEWLEAARGDEGAEAEVGAPGPWALGRGGAAGQERRTWSG